MRAWSEAMLWGLVMLAGTMNGARADEITILTSQGVMSAIKDLAPAFERATGHKVIVAFESGPAFMQKVDAKAPADLVAQGPELVDELIAAGKVTAGTRVDFARAGVGVAVKAGAPRPDIGTAAAFKQAMLDAKSIVYSKTGFSGVYAAQLMQRLGIAEQVKAKTVLVEGVPVAVAIAKGEGEIGIQQINVILPIAGADYIGPLPTDLQAYVPFALGVLSISKAPAAAMAFARFAAAPDNAALIRKGGMEPMPR
jgi:molybdate transport system substrate-binding protein